MNSKEDPKGEFDPLRQPLLSHLLELRRRLINALLAMLAGFIVSYSFAPRLYTFLVAPLAAITKGENRTLIYTGLTEAFVTYIKLSLWMGCFLGFPVMAYQLYMFVAPGLYKHERSVFVPFLIAVPLFFLTGAAMAYYIVFPLAWKFFLSFEIPSHAGSLPIQLEARVSEYLSLSMTIIFAFGLAFQLPVLLVLLARLGLLSSQSLSTFRRYSIVLIFIVAALLTPPDLISMLALALPLTLLYELSIVGARWAEKAHHKARDSDDLSSRPSQGSPV